MTNADESHARKPEICEGLEAVANDCLLLLRGATRKIAEKVTAGDVSPRDAEALLKIIEKSSAMACEMRRRRDLRAK